VRYIAVNLYYATQHMKSATPASHYHSTDREPHRDRTRQIIVAHPEIRTLIGRNPYTFFITLGVVALQFGLAFVLRQQSWWLIALCAYAIGAFANHSLYVMIHEYTHNLVFKKPTLNKLCGILADTANAIPSAISFRLYHIKHHAHQGAYDLDADLPSRWEARLTGHSALGKALWLLFFPLFQGLRPPRLRALKFLSAWTLLNIAVVFAVNIASCYFFGAKFFGYLFASFWFSISLHPLGARWIQEHFVVHPMQETYSYYGPLNVLAMNVGYHNEHHDFPSIPWNRLPRVRALAPEWYDPLTSHRSWAKLLLQFIFDPRLSLRSRVERTDAEKVE